jgi:prolipoprotein diacylglyceryltransferase
LSICPAEVVEGEVVVDPKASLPLTEERRIYFSRGPRQSFTLDLFRSGGIFYGGFIAAVIVAVIVARRRRRFEGQIMLAYAALYAVARFVIEFWRNDPRGSFVGLSTSQLIAVIVFLGAIGIGVIRTTRSFNYS